ncbi:MAG: antitoxin Xre/MbcA/ParS toxin-binding domain-containing protein [Gammaproteobacteria bacterium]|uniref:Uncharacterized protein DUF2384 n=1 Tax=Pseudacidovorax intermedius TaxID=433924 RepID=A0A370FBT5_9BURK|nr:antitoxin Xre/MbcA/ParS toxin-binding domain-containing protein [Pseudacidovorax intermedius]RDI22706.1 uncharacterized protein DUF2384 [Pseudacidovorax intermedius]
MTARASSVEALEAEIARLTQERRDLERQQRQLRVDELKALVDHFAQQLGAAGFGLQDGIDALQARARPAPPPVEQPARHSVIKPAPFVTAPKSQPRPPMDAVHLRAQSVLGSDAIDWLQRAHPLLGGMTPTQMAATPRGEEKVLALLAAYARGA